MLTRHEREHLVDEYRRQPVSAVGLLVTCAGALLAVIVLALIGLDMHLFTPAPHASAVTQRAP